MKKARLIFLVSLALMAIAAFKGNPHAENNVPAIAHPPASVKMADSSTNY